MDDIQRFANESTLTIVNNAARLRYLESQSRGVRSLVKLADATAPGGIPSITFSSIPTDYAHLLLNIFIRSDKAAVTDTLFLRLNGDSGANYQYIGAQQKASAITYFEGIAASGAFVGDVPAASAPANSFCGFTSSVFRAQGATFKSIQTDGTTMAGLTTGLIYSYSCAGVWLSTAVINSLTLVLGAGNIVANSYVSLYGEP
jgi:hypothetical protein